MRLKTKHLTLAEGWRVIHDPDNVGKNEKWRKGIPKEGWVPARVPGFVHQFIPECRGIAWYEYEFDALPERNENEVYLLSFAMAEWHTEVWLNGREVGVHDGCEDPFSFDVTKQANKGRNRLVVRVSKPYTEDVDGYSFWQIPHRNEMAVGLHPGQCYNAFGLSGEVTLSVLPKLYMEDMYLFANTETGRIEASFTVRSAFDAPVTASLSLVSSIKRTGEEVAESETALTFAPGVTEVKQELTIPDFLWWDIDDPNLYLVSASIETDTGCHRLTKHCGFRTFAVNEDNGFFYLNGRRIFVRCSHTGNCMPESFHHITKKKELLRRDFSMAKAVGFNMVRFISGCALPEQLDYCDELGLMVYEEPVAGWCMMDGPDAEARLRHDLYSMIRRDRSHPSVTIFGFLNETPTRKPYGKVYLYARRALAGARELDPTRLFLYSSGRFDAKAVSGEEYDPWCGSFSNPGKVRWQSLWNEDTPIPHKYEKQREAEGLPQAYKPAGDIHDYPMGPISKTREMQLRTLGNYTKRPVFVSEIGIGSMFNALWLERKFEEMHASPDAPDVKVTKKMAEDFVEGLRKFGFADEYPFPIDILRASERQNNRARSAIFSILRSNPYCNGVSLTGLLDHSVCGEGFFTFMREFKPGIADTLQNGFAPTRWCLFLYDTHVFRNRPFGMDAVLAMEDTLAPGDYPVSLRISASDHRTVWAEDLTLHITEEDTKLFSVPVLKKDITLDVPSGEYELRAELMQGGAATDGTLKFFVTDPDEIKASVKEIVGVCLTDQVRDFLAGKGVEVLPLSEAPEKAVVLVGDIPEGEREETWKKLRDLIAAGSRVFAASRYSFVKGSDWSYYMPLPDGEKPRNANYGRHTSDWLYHKEYLLKRDHPYCKGLPVGMMDPDYFNFVISSHAFIYDTCPRLPDDVAAMATSLGLPWGLEDRSSIKADGVEIGTYHLGAGALTICAFHLLENVSVTPAADRLLLNILNTEAERL